MQQQQRTKVKTGYVKPSHARIQGIFTGVGLTVVLFVILGVVLIFMPQDWHKQTETKAQLGNAAFEVSVTRKEMNALVEQYLNNDPKLKNKIRFEMGTEDMMVFGTQKMLGQNVDLGIRMDPTVTKQGNIKLTAKSIAVGQLPLPVSYIMKMLDSMVDLPNWMTVNPQAKTILIDLGKTPEVSGIRVKAITINPQKNQFIFRGGYEK
ncbi:MAG: YpmS family protein [Lactobacillaceae bacterium]|jgi:uncharacterized protein YpmS|nr:YpmS family protein [Lactobacillaceae bacterium]